MTIHPDGVLSSYADDDLEADRAPAVTAHLSSCPRCSARVEELRVVRRLLSAAPAPRPSRSLVPQLRAGPAWLRPVRSLASIGAGTFLFLFLASAVLHSGGSLGGGTTSAERAAARGQLSAPAAAPSPQVPQIPRSTGSKATDASSAAAPAAGGTPPAVALGDHGAAPDVGRRELGPPPWVFAGLAALCGGVALGVHRRLRRA